MNWPPDPPEEPAMSREREELWALLENASVPMYLIELVDRVVESLEKKASGAKRGGLRPGTAKRNFQTRAAAIGRAEQLRPQLAPMAAQGASLREMAQTLAAAGTTTTKGNPLSPTQIKRLLGALGLLPVSGRSPT
jgi:hypothetical protein